jgi:hypothetical protein
VLDGETFYECDNPMAITAREHEMDSLIEWEIRRRREKEATRDTNVISDTFTVLVSARRALKI